MLRMHRVDMVAPAGRGEQRATATADPGGHPIEIIEAAGAYG
jgi:hypothetical protein